MEVKVRFELEIDRRRHERMSEVARRACKPTFVDRRTWPTAVNALVHISTIFTHKQKHNTTRKSVHTTNTHTPHT